MFFFFVLICCSALALWPEVDLEEERTANTPLRILVDMDTLTTAISETFSYCLFDTVRVFQLLPASPPI